jgi:heat shock protein HslJ
MMVRRLFTMGVAVALLLAITGLASVAVAGAGGVGGQLEGRLWVLRVYATGATMDDVPPGVDANATFEGGTVAGKSGCNTFSGSYTASGASLTVGALATTMKLCGEPGDVVESAYLTALSKSATYTATSRALFIFDADGRLILYYVVGASTPIAGHTWHLLVYNNGTGGVVPIIAGTHPTAAFDPDGTVSGDATCNQFIGPYTAKDGAGTIGPLASTMMACPTAAQSDQEAAYLAALANAKAYLVQGSDLVLRDASGALQAEFTAVPISPMPVYGR